jgi:dTDP-4-dehydrorhamnose reductase
MLGHTVLRLFAPSPGYSAVGSVRSRNALELLPQELRAQVISGLDVENIDALMQLFARVKPDVVINCIGVVKQLSQSEEPLTAIPINSLLPHRLLRLCKLTAARLIHVSTDCVFSGMKGRYLESERPDAADLYGRSKLLGEVEDTQAVTLRTSIIGPELGSGHGLFAWFMAQRLRTKGYTRAIFSGLPTIELARIIRDIVIPRADIAGLYHVSADPISKFDLLSLIASAYGLSIDIEPDHGLVIDRSLDSSRFNQLTGYTAPTWPQLIRAMHDFG